MRTEMVECLAQQVWTVQEFDVGAADGEVELTDADAETASLCTRNSSSVKTVEDWAHDGDVKLGMRTSKTSVRMGTVFEARWLIALEHFFHQRMDAVSAVPLLASYV